MLTDTELLRRYAAQRDEDAFATLVARHLDLVHSAAVRRVNGRTDLAEDITQKVFTDLARKAAALVHHPALVGWLHRSTRYASIDAVRAEQRRQLAETSSAMTPTESRPEPVVDWVQLRPVLDEAMDHLRERDREAVLLRFFHHLGYGEIGRRLRLSENAARMRTERALDRLRVQLERRGVSSTAALLGGALTTHAVVAAPASLATATAQGALAAVPAAGAFSTLKTFLLMNTSVAPAASALLAATLTAVTWFAVADPVAAEDLAQARAEHAQLTAAAADASAAPSTTTTAATEADYAARAAQTLSAFASVAPQRAGRSATDDSGHRDRGNATARDAEFTFAWAAREGNVAELTRLMTFDPPARTKAQEIWRGMPDAVRAAYPTPEALYAFFVAADALISPPPGADVGERLTFVELAPDRFASRWPGRSQNFHEFQLTDDGWKFVMPLLGVEHMPAILQNETLLELAGH